MFHWHGASGSLLGGAYTPPKMSAQIACSVGMGTAATVFPVAAAGAAAAVAATSAAVMVRARRAFIGVPSSWEWTDCSHAATAPEPDEGRSRVGRGTTRA